MRPVRQRDGHEWGDRHDWCACSIDRNFPAFAAVIRFPAYARSLTGLIRAAGASTLSALNIITMRNSNHSRNMYQVTIDEHGITDAVVACDDKSGKGLTSSQALSDTG